MVEYNRFRDVDYRVNRFFCDCGWASHVLEISEDLDCRAEDRHIEVCIYTGASDSFFKRVWTALKYIFGKKNMYHADFVLDPKERVDLAEAILPEKLE